MGCADSVPSIFSFLGGSATPWIYDHYGGEYGGGLWKAFIFGAMTCVFSLIAAICLAKLDSTARKRDKMMRLADGNENADAETSEFQD